LIGIVLELILRGIFIGIGAAAINAWSWVFYLFGIFLVFTAVQLLRHNDADSSGDNAVVRFATRHLSATNTYHGMKMTVIEGGKRLVTPMFMVILALGMTDVMFALDSIPAIFGLTQEPYLVWTANALALMGLRQLYFLIGGLLERLVFLSHGLSVILVFIGIKLIFHALHENTLPFLNDGEPVHAVPDISTAVSLTVIITTLLVTTVASLLYSRKRRSPASELDSDHRSDDETETLAKPS
jgi:tellurite resistance protein TerC